MGKTIDVQGTKVYINGEGKSVIVMIHGWPDTHEIWQRQVDFFKRDFTCVTFTLPGFEKNDDGKCILSQHAELSSHERERQFKGNFRDCFCQGA